MGIGPVPPRGICFETHIVGLGGFALRPLEVAHDAALVHDWVTRDYARYWAMGDKTRAEIVSFYEALMASRHALALVGLFETAPAFLVETYDPAHDEVGEHYVVRAGDRGMHVLVGPATTPIAGFTQAIFRTVMDYVFSDPGVRRVVVEPDVRNDKIHKLNRRFGFLYDREVDFQTKRAALAFCTRQRYLATLTADLTA